jgi:hypothetical protein
MLHFADRLFIFLLAEFFQPPVPVHARMQEILGSQIFCKIFYIFSKIIELL